MTDTNIKVREHYSATRLTDRIKAALPTITPESQALTVAQLAPLDQFHTRGILATGELAAATRLDSIDARAGSRVGHRRSGALSRGDFRLQGDRHRPEPRVPRCG
jgi:hypothetical protein